MAVELVGAAKVIAKLLSAGLSIYRAARGHGKPDELENDVKAIQGLLDAGVQLATEFRATTRVQARHIALVVAAFGQAWSDQYGPRLALEKSRAVIRHREAAVRWALAELPRLGMPAPAAEIDLLDRLLAGVLETPCYHALWEAFTKRNLPDLEAEWLDPLIEVFDGADKRAFETRVRRAYAEVLASPAGAEVRACLLDLASDRGRLVRELLVRDIATWGARHVFGNVATHTRLPDMPLAEMYVEPLSVSDTGSVNPKAVATPILELLNSMLKDAQVLVVMAHFGHGKSLSARTLAWKLAVGYLEDSTTPGPDRALPVFVKCVEDLPGSDAKLPRMVERALWRQVGRGFDLGLKDTDSAFSSPPESQRTIFLIDGLDEFALTPSGVVQLFEHLRGQASAQHKVIVFSRPEVLPRKRLRELGIPVLELQAFSTTGGSGGQVGEWLIKWNNHAQDRPKISIDEIRARGLFELAQTPILLFMIAETWNRVGDTSGQVLQADLYEAFLSQVARGKHEADKDSHNPIAETAERLQHRLIERGRIPSDASLDQAMLWALSRIAWESHCLEQQEKPLTQRKVGELLDRELQLDDEATHEALCDGVLLALQADFAPGSSRILFGHRSFREFLVARYWERNLWQITSRDSSEWRAMEVALLGGRLLGREDRSFAFLTELLEHWDVTQRADLRRWAEQTFNDERISLLDEMSGAIFYGDRRSYLREAALAIGSHVTQKGTGIVARHSTVLRSLLAWFWARGQQAIIRAPGLIHPEAELANVSLFGADLTGANLQGAILNSASLYQVSMPNAILTGAELSHANFADADLDGARIDRAQATGANFHEARLIGTDFSASVMARARFHDCSFGYTNFSGTDLSNGSLRIAELRRSGSILTENTNLNNIREIIECEVARRSAIVGEVYRVLSAMVPVDFGISWYEFYEIDHESNEVEEEQQDMRHGDGMTAGLPTEEVVSPRERTLRFRAMIPSVLVEIAADELRKIPGVTVLRPSSTTELSDEQTTETES